MYQAILFDLDHTLLMPEVSVQEKLLALDVAGEPLYDAASAREAHRQAELWTARQILHELETNTRMEDDLFLEQVLSIYRKESNVHSDAAKELIIERGYDPLYGARPLRRVLQSSVETLVARTILRGDISAGSTITVDARDGELVVV